MKKPGLVVLGGLLSFALIALGCSSGSGGGNNGGSGGGAGKGGSGGGGTGGKGGTGGGNGGTGGGGGSGGGTGGTTDGGANDGAITDGSTDGTTAAAFTSIGSFNSDLEGFTVLSSSDNLKVDGGTTTATLEFDSTSGSPSSGSAKLTIPLSGAAGMFAQVDVGKGFAITNLAGKILTARVMLDATDGGITNQLGVQLVFKTGTSYVYANGGFQSLTPGKWQQFFVPFDAPTTANTGYDATMIREVDVEVQGSIPAAFTGSAVLHIDAIGTIDPTVGFNSIGAYATDLEGFTVLASSDNLKVDGGITATLDFDSSAGAPSPGSAKLTLPLDGAAGMFAQADVGKGFAITNLAGKVLTARVMLDATDGGITNQLATQLVFKTGSGYVYANGGYQALTPGKWQQFFAALDLPSTAGTGYDATMVREVDVEVQGSIPAGFTGSAVVHIDTVGTFPGQ